MKRYLIVLACMPIIALMVISCGNQAKINVTAEQAYNSSPLSAPRPPSPFQSDGCSCWPDGDWLACCVKHDLLYWQGGTREERKAADLALKTCVAESGHPVIGQAMYLGVRIGGLWWLPTPFRWGFGWKYPDSGPPGKAY